MHIYIHHTYIHIYIYIYIHTYIHISYYLYTHIGPYRPIFGPGPKDGPVWPNMCIDSMIYLYMYAYMYVYNIMYDVCTYVCIYIYNADRADIRANIYRVFYKCTFLRNPGL